MNFKVKPEDVTPQSAMEAAEGMAAGFKKAFGRRFSVGVELKDGKALMTVEGRDSGQSVMTVDDVAALIDVSSDAVWKLIRATDHPLPHFAVSDKVIRFKRENVIAWMDEAVARGAVPKVTAPHKG